MRDQEVIVVTGAASGIGKAVAIAAHDEGANVIALDVDEERLADIDLEHLAMRVACDVADENSVNDAFAEIGGRFGAPTGVFANAGIEVHRSLHMMSDADWERVIRVNLTGVFHTCRAALRMMVEASSGGSIVCTSSPSAFVGFAGGNNAAYAASKGALSALVRSMAIDYAAMGIRINAVVPGATDTPLLLANTDPGRVEAERVAIQAAAVDQIPLQRLGRAEEVAAAVLWLLSDASSYVTGSHLVCDGGLLAKGANTF